MGFFDRFRLQRKIDAPPAVPETQTAAVADNNETPSITFNNNNITYTGDLKTFDYNGILRDKQAHINDLYKLSDYYVDADPIFRGIIKEVYTPFSVADQYKLVGANEEVKKRYEAYYKKIHLMDKMESIFYQYFKYANVYVYLMPDGRIITLPPTHIRIGNVMVDGEPVMEFNCRRVRDEFQQSGGSLKPFIDDAEMAERLKGYPPEVTDGVISGKEWVQLDYRNAYALQDVKEDWMRYSVPMIASCLKALQKKEIISNWENAVLNLGMRSFVHVTYGDPDGQVLPNIEQLSAVQNVFKKAMSGSALAVTNHWATAKFVQPDLDEMFRDDKYASVNADILSSGGISGIIVSGRTDDGSTYATAQVSMQTAAIRIRKARNNFCEMMNKINHRINEAGFRVMPHSAKEQIPEFTFPPVDLAGSKAFQETCYKLWDKGMVSKETMLQSYGFDMQQEIERRKAEQVNGADEVLVDPHNIDYGESANNQVDSGDIQSREGYERYTRNGKVYWRRKRQTTRHDDSDEETTVGRPTLDDSERNSSPYNSVTGRNPKPSNPEGSEAQT